MSASKPHSERLREIRVYLAEDAAIDDMPRAHPSSPTPMLRDLLAAYDGLEEQFEAASQEIERLTGIPWPRTPRSSPATEKGRALRDEQFEYDYQMGTTPDE